MLLKCREPRYGDMEKWRNGEVAMIKIHNPLGLQLRCGMQVQAIII